MGINNPTNDEDNNDDNSQGNFFEENKSLLIKIYNILKLQFPNLNISLSELLTAAQKYIDMYANNPGHGSGEGDVGEGDEPKPEIDLSQFNDDDIDAIVKGFCKIYKTDWEEFKNFVINGEKFKEKEPDESLEKELYKDENISEFKKQDELRIKKLEKAIEYINKNKSSDEDPEIKQKLVEFCLKDKTAVLDYIEYLLKVYFDKWLLPDGSGDRFPYVINSHDRYYQIIKSENDEENKIVYYNGDTFEKCKEIKEYVTGQDIRALGSGFASETEKYMGKMQKLTSSNNNIVASNKRKIYYKIENDQCKVITESEKKDCEKNNIKVYSCNKYDKKESLFIIANDDTYIKSKYLKEKDPKTSDDYKINTNYDLQQYWKGKDHHIQQGKGAVEILSNISLSLYDRYKNIPENDKNKLKKILENFLKVGSNYSFKNYLYDFSLGVDCSSYVSRALSFMMTNLHIPKEIQIKTIGDDGSKKNEYVRTNCTHLAVNSKDDDGKKFFNGDAGSLFLLNNPNTAKVYFNNDSFKNYNPFVTSDQKNSIDKIANLTLIKNLKKLDKNKEEKYGVQIDPVPTFSERTQLQVGDILSTSDPYFHIKIISKVDNDSFNHIQSTSVERKGVVETTVDSSNINKEMKNYWFARPHAFSNDKELIEYFKNMLIAKGKEPN